MTYIDAVQAGVTAIEDCGPSAAELDAIEREMPLIIAELELLDAQIAVLDRVPSELDARRLRRALRRVLAVRLALMKHSGTGEAA
ncbi:DUF6284 family protein [Streptomyces griseocarneus]|uniref:DUF6284 family protein n=1 Tax=Streptomyces griseocarneus TaxID=51201 RepID=UPI00167D15E3|nr:DUF6284 family protein [Streptomyces griseocarneus]MBZ6477505.1 DUF6284 family protein [Streptomyces griseocarneus]GHG82800.1 hypothetical protein GCM10018779_65740 [Streptomyces griseocarneus]